MQAKTFISTLAAMAATASATAILPRDEVDATFNTTHPLLAKRDDFSCAGSGLCGTVSMEPTCDSAINNLRRGGTYQYAASTPGVDSGNCAQLPEGWGLGCGIFLEGPPDCKGMGDDLWWGAQQIKAAGCKICGYKDFTGEQGSACKLTINYVSGCQNVSN